MWFCTIDGRYSNSGILEGAQRNQLAEAAIAAYQNIGVMVTKEFVANNSSFLTHENWSSLQRSVPGRFKLWLRPEVDVTIVTSSFISSVVILIFCAILTISSFISFVVILIFCVILTISCFVSSVILLIVYVTSATTSLVNFVVILIICHIHDQFLPQFCCTFDNLSHSWPVPSSVLLYFWSFITLTTFISFIATNVFLLFCSFYSDALAKNSQINYYLFFFLHIFKFLLFCIILFTVLTWNELKYYQITSKTAEMFFSLLFSSNTLTVRVPDTSAKFLGVA